MNKYFRYGFEKNASDRPDYIIGGAVLGAFSRNSKEDSAMLHKYKLKVMEKVHDWRGIVESKSPISKSLVSELHGRHKYDPDNAGVPYYFLVKNNATNQRNVLYGGDSKWYPINNSKERQYAITVGKNKGLKKEHLDFKASFIRPHSSARIEQVATNEEVGG